MECVVEVVKLNRGVIIGVMYNPDSEVEAGCLLASVVSKVLEARQEFCHSLAADVFLVDPDFLRSHPGSSVDEENLFDMSEVRDVLQSQSKRRVVSVGGGRTLSLGHLWTHTMWSKSSCVG